MNLCAVMNDGSAKADAVSQQSATARQNAGPGTGLLAPPASGLANLLELGNGHIIVLCAAGLRNGMSL